MVAQIDNAYTKYSFSKTIQRLASYSLFEGRPHTTKGQWFNPIVFGILKSLAIIPGSPNVSKPVFITGMGRSGTTILGIVLSLHKQLSYLNEPKAIWTLIDKRTDVVGDYVEQDGSYSLDQTDTNDVSRLKANRIFSRYLTLVRGERLLDKYPELIFRIGYVLGLFPDAKIIFITRNGNDACASIARWSSNKEIENQGDVENWWGRNDLKWKNLSDQILTQDQYSLALNDIDLSKIDDTNRAALEWIVTMQEGLKQELLFPGKILRVNYENLVNNPKQELQHLFDFCDLNYDESVISYAKQKLYQLKPKPAPELLKPIENLFNKTMNDLGYN